MEEQPLLVKYECLSEDCEEQFLVNIEKAKENVLACPYCRGPAEATASENPDAEERGLVYGCLYPR
ncbi:hypothetical protein [Paenibacillus sp. FSL R7-0331]|uniref:hypothetical protein n=1 Tax=Paenibacillus sp. FSL R7-0331 TaxID=1536773 RepID=UPI0004F68585|nr:hypothetical protein [Paenibacillus sp. FSL R7-0331]AIQ54582.1 hypothetical protein R70331_25790 [Paenibacillus sp. FSL R7-0331]